MNILYPMFGMILLSCFVVIALYLSRLIPVIKNFGNLLQDILMNLDLNSGLRNITANYNHIFEQPTLFYATIIYIYLMGHNDKLYLAWAYVGLRQIQLTLNNVSMRVVPFIFSDMSNYAYN